AKNREREQQVDRSQRPQAPEAHLVIDVSEGTERKGGADTRGERRDCPLEDVTGEVGRRTQVAAIGRCGYRPADLDRVGVGVVDHRVASGYRIGEVGGDTVDRLSGCPSEGYRDRQSGGKQASQWLHEERAFHMGGCVDGRGSASCVLGLRAPFSVW